MKNQYSTNSANVGDEPTTTHSLADILGTEPDPFLTMTIDGDKARRLLENANPAYQRETQDKTVNRYEGSMKLGTWEPDTVITFGKIGARDGFYVLNGKHRLTALAKCGREQRFAVHLLSFADETALQAHVEILDNGKTRTPGDIATIAGLDMQLGIGKDWKAFQAAINCIISGWSVSTGGGPSEALPNVMHPAAAEWAPFFRAYEAMLPKRDSGDKDSRAWRRKLLKAPLLAVAMVTLRCQPEKAEGFWRTVTSRDVGDDTIASLIALMRGSEPDNSRDRVNTVAMAWNAYVAGQALEIVNWGMKYKGAPAEHAIWLDGTPYCNAYHTYYSPCGERVFYRRYGFDVLKGADWVSYPITGRQPAWLPTDEAKALQDDERKQKKLNDALNAAQRSGMQLSASSAA